MSQAMNTMIPMDNALTMVVDSAIKITNVRLNMALNKICHFNRRDGEGVLLSFAILIGMLKRANPTCNMKITYNEGSCHI
ncbi:hypothetical protein DOS68_09255 [Staphylococcus felis]|uniref:Uncharacterized protein n=1 Tax=Staphylococcus felis TaxID=46127 RepID=A0AAX1RX53_9STAP|nr:hypothetical protein C7J90_04065 [Staphylococcus felis]PNZ35763.1 hypothetical protein CD143_05460 [Staphylococcus felis]REH84954.1 hypothetical protein DOS63_05950 [Staphylococcus felis]REH89054.1 hypothetical protein DOS68_09255 [Staphylococcus felis]REH99887.1 hypothetical protein DOS64_07715 [Staphylococcus felis]